MTLFVRTVFAGALALATAAATAQTIVTQAWVRGTVAQQKASGAFMRITSPQGGKLVSVASPVAGLAEVHEMAMDGNTMKMRPVKALDLPAGKTVVLEPGGYHVMLMDLKQPLGAGQTVPLSLVVEGKDGKRETIEVQAPVQALGAPAGSKTEHKH